MKLLSNRLIDTDLMQGILLITYQYINDPGISLHTLAREKLFMNEEHLGRLFLKLTGMRFSAFLEDRRMRQAQQLLRFRPDLKISQLAELVGYPELKTQNGYRATTQSSELRTLLESASQN